MAIRYSQVRVVDASGRPVKDAKVSIFVHQFMASGFVSDQYTNADGLAQFELDCDNGAEVTISVNGYPKTSRGTIQGQYSIFV